MSFSALHIESDLKIRTAVASVFAGTAHKLAQSSSVENTDLMMVRGIFDLYLCGTIGKHSDGLILALDLHEHGRPTVVVAYRRKFSKIPFMSVAMLRDKAGALALFERLAGG